LNLRSGETVEFEFDEDIKKIIGHVVLAKFRSMGVAERLGFVWAAIRDRFGANSQDVSLVLAFSPEEWAAMNEQSASA